MRKIKMASVLLGIGLAACAWADAEKPVTMPIGLSLVPDVSFPCAACSVKGVRLNLLAGEHQDVSFVDLALIANLTDGVQSGLQFSPFYNRAASGRGVFQFTAIANQTFGDFSGMQLAAIWNDITGAGTGLQVSLLNTAKKWRGLQIGLVNSADDSTGMQIGLVNYAGDVSTGIQVGLVNVMPGAEYTVCPIFNASF